LEKNVLNDTGSYVEADGKTLSLQQAITAGKMKHIDIKIDGKREASDTFNSITKTESGKKVKAVSTTRVKSPTSPSSEWETVTITVEPADKGFSQIRNDIIQRRSKMSFAKDSVEQTIGCLKHSLKETTKSTSSKESSEQIKRSSRNTVASSIDTRDIKVVKGEERFICSLDSLELVDLVVSFSECLRQPIVCSTESFAKDILDRR
jgi:hypothetical protein